MGRQLTELTILATARELDQPYEWALHELEALVVGLDGALSLDSPALTADDFTVASALSR